MANKARPKKVVERFEAEVMVVNCGRASLDVDGWTYHIPTREFRRGDLVEVTVKLLKRKA